MTLLVNNQRSWRHLSGSINYTQPFRHLTCSPYPEGAGEGVHGTLALHSRDAAAMDLTTLDDNLGVVKTDKGSALQPLGASLISSRVVRDEDLSWNQLTEVKTKMIGRLKMCGWTEHEVSQLVLL